MPNVETPVRPAHTHTAASVAAIEPKREQAIEARANAELRKSSYYAVRHVRCEVRSNVLILQGRVRNFYMKQIAQTVLRYLLEDGMTIDNQVEVD